MGYYVRLEDNNVLIPRSKLEDAYQAMCRLNETHNKEKRGGSWVGGKETKHFSWMDANYPETCPSALDIIEALGFGTELDTEGITIQGYDNKTGSEDLFFESIAPFIEKQFESHEKYPFMEWTGEEGARWRWIFKDGKMITKHATISYDVD